MPASKGSVPDVRGEILNRLLRIIHLKILINHNNML